MYNLKITFKDGRVIEKSAAYSPTISHRLFDAWQRDSSTAKVELFNPAGERIALVKKGL